MSRRITRTEQHAAHPITPLTPSPHHASTPAVATPLYRRALRLSFDLGAPLYAWGTAQNVWRGSGARMAASFPEPWAPRVLDLGTGPGVSIVGMHEQRPDARYLGLDLAETMLREARPRLTSAGVRAPLMRADAAHIPLRRGEVDVVVGHSFLYLLPDPVAVLREVRRLLTPGGLAIFLEPRVGAVLWKKLLRTHWRDVRFLITMGGWRAVSGMEGRYTPLRFKQEVEAADLEMLGTSVTLYGLGLLCTACAY